jgi:hypothetical protein
MLTMKSKLRLTGAFAALAILALAASCQGFFPKATILSIALNPSAPSFGVGFTQSMQVFGTDSNNNRYQLTSGVDWTVADPSSGTVATIDSTTGTMTGVNPGTITVNASYQALSASGTATVVENVSSMTITPSTNSVPDDNVSVAQFSVSGVTGSGSQDITSLVTLTAEQNGVAVGTSVACGYNSGDGFQECMAGPSLPNLPQVYQIVVTYSGYTGTAVVQATLTVIQ